MAGVDWLGLLEGLGGLGSAAAIVFAVVTFRHQRREDYCRKLRGAVVSIILSMSRLRTMFRRSFYHEYARQAVYSPQVEVVVRKIFGTLWNKSLDEAGFRAGVEAIVNQNLIVVLPHDTQLAGKVERTREELESAFAVLYRDVPSLHQVLMATYLQVLVVMKTCQSSLENNDSIWTEAFVAVWKRSRDYVDSVEILQNELVDFLRAGMLATHEEAMGPDLDSCFQLAGIAANNFLEMTDRRLHRHRGSEKIKPLDQFSLPSQGIDYKLFRVVDKGLSWLSAADRQDYNAVLSAMLERQRKLFEKAEQRSKAQSAKARGAAPAAPAAASQAREAPTSGEPSPA